MRGMLRNEEQNQTDPKEQYPTQAHLQGR